MNTKKAGGLFLTIILCHLAISVLLLFYVPPVFKNMIGNLVVSEMLIWVPAVLFLAVSKTNPLKLCRMRKVHVSTLFMTALFTFLCMPLVTLTNALSMLFVDNTVAQVSPMILQMPFLPMFLVMAVYGPFAEEFVFRGILYQSFKKQGNVLAAVILSALAFALMHMNFNQAAYALVVGILLAVLMEACDSIWPAFVFHMLVNGSSVVILYLTQHISADLMDAAAQMAGNLPRQELYMAVCVYVVLAVVFTPIAGCVLVWIAGREGRLAHVKYIWHSRKNGLKGIFPAAFLLAAIISLGYMIFLVIRS